MLRYSSPDRIAVPGSIVARTVEGRTVLLDTAGGRYYALDEIGARIWTLLASGPTLGSVIEALLAEYDVTRETLEADVESLVARLEDAGLVEVTRD